MHKRILLTRGGIDRTRFIYFNKQLHMTHGSEINAHSTYLLGLALLCLAVLPTPVRAQSDTSQAYVRVPVNISFVPGISIGDLLTAGTDAKIINRFSINLLAGRAARLHGVEFGSVWNGYTESIRGAQFSGVVNTVGGTVRGGQFAGVLNYASGYVYGVQFGAVNVAEAPVSGGQFAGVLNYAGEGVHGVQVGVVNVAGASVRGAQIAGVLNVASRVEEGVQIGVINVAGRHDGVPIGLVSYVGDVGLRYDVWVDETGMVTTAVRSGNRRFANYLGVAARPGGDTFHWGFVVGFGVDFPVTERIGGSFDLLNYGLLSDDWDWEEWHTLSKARLLGRIRISPHLALFGGPTFNVFVSDDADGSNLAPWSVYDAEVDGTYVRLWPGATLGVRLTTRAM